MIVSSYFESQQRKKWGYDKKISILGTNFIFRLFENHISKKLNDNAGGIGVKSLILKIAKNQIIVYTGSPLDLH